MWTLLITMVERIGIIVTIAFVLTRLRFFRDMIYQEQLQQKQLVTATLFFGFFGIIGTYTGLNLEMNSLQFSSWTFDLASDEALANSRVIGVVLAGLLGGYRVGLGAGIIAGIHRFTLGGFTGLACGLSSIIAGLLAGLFHRKDKHVKLSTAFLLGALAEAFQMVIILLISRPFSNASALVELIGLPMIFANGTGCALFLLVIKSVVNEEEKAGALQAQKTLRIADKTLAYLRKGLNNQSAEAVCKIILTEIHASAVAMTNSKEILAHVGLGYDHHRTDSPIQTKITREVLQKGEIIVANHNKIHCREEGCPLNAAVIAPLKQRGQTIGTLKFYFQSEKEISNVVLELISGLSSMISNELEISAADQVYQLAKEAEIKALQAQISPHFLFNSLNTIVSLVRIDPAKARKLLVTLSQYLRQNLSVTTQSMTVLEEELRHVKAYLSIEQARFVNKLDVIYHIDKNVLSQKIPPLTLQPLVENAIKHGFKNKDNDCKINIMIQRETDTITVKIIDNGQGMAKEQLDKLGVAPIQSAQGSGLAIYNVNRRLTMVFGNKSALKVTSAPNKGTEITFSIPYEEENVN
ncbi:sensor histidine kinase [Bacillus niameyensis]|uniref:sensor histidine kinase n=1 Tax=Bacillus niameyensis TaxID=1522308 RepID=UPI000780AB11|nr:sensor histidine kinase [Bacillus niameyensis]